MSTGKRKEWTPPEGGWGENTEQARLARGDEPIEWEGDQRWTDAYEMRMRFNIPAFDPESDDYYGPYPDCLLHEKPASVTDSAGGTDWLRIGERDSGKSNDNLHWAIRLLDANDERVVWRGSPQRSEWLPLKDWTTLFLPKNASVDADWLAEGDLDATPEDTDLEAVVREVVRYDDPVDLLEQLEARPGGTFNVVYPDPSFTGCFDLTRVTDRVSEPLPFVPKWQALGDEPGTPLVHWWYAFMLAAVEQRQRYSWLSVVFDEAGDLTPEDAENDEHRTYKKLTLLRSVYSDSRRRRLSIYWSAHYEENLHHKIRREVQWRIDMADGTPNPRKKSKPSIPVGFGTVPMIADVMSDKPKGTALLYNQANFDLYQWKHIEREDLGQRWLQIRLGKPERPAEDDEPEPGETVRYDDSVFKRWRKPGEDRLYVRDPGQGYVDLKNGAAGEELAWPKPGWRFSELEERGETIAIELRPDVGDGTGVEDPDDAVLVAEFPKPEIGGLDDDSSLEGES